MPRSQAGLGLHWYAFGACVLFAMSASLIGRSTQVRPDAATSDTTDDPRQRGRDYEAHVFAEERLPRSIKREGGQLQLHPHIRPPRVLHLANYYGMPGGFDSGPKPDASPHPSAVLQWTTRLLSTYRVPDAIARFPGGIEVLHELKCTNPWLTFDGGTAWAAKMQATFGSQALAFFAWADQHPERRRVLYGFCGRVPPWAAAILADLRQRFPLVSFELRAVFWAQDFEPAHQLVQRAARDAMIAALATMGSKDLFGAPFDKLSD